MDGINDNFSSSAAASSGAIPMNGGSNGSGERGEMFSGEMGVEMCEEMVRGRAPYIGSMVRPKGMGAACR